MPKLAGKNIVLGVTGGIAAYKTPELVRRLKDHGANVRVVLTSGAQAFVTPLSLQAVSGNSVSDDLLDRDAELAMGHIELAKWADLLLIAPASANTMAKLAHGMANDLLSTIALATSSPIAIAPAMNQQMWHAKATQANLAIIKSYGINIWGPGAGEQACGDVGLGRMLEVDELVLLTTEFLSEKTLNAKPLSGQSWVITAGPTREAIDPVRYISNYSSGKMGYAIAQQAALMGAEVTIVSGPVALPTPEGCKRIDVKSAKEMHQQALSSAKGANVFIACAAVADFRPASIAEQKMKKQSGEDEMTITLVKNPDIVADVASMAEKPFTVGFAAETQDVEQYAKAKLARKGLDLIAANDVAKPGQGFNSDENALTVFSATQAISIELASKSDVAKKLIDIISSQYGENRVV